MTTPPTPLDGVTLLIAKYRAVLTEVNPPGLVMTHHRLVHVGDLAALVDAADRCALEEERNVVLKRERDEAMQGMRGMESLADKYKAELSALKAQLAALNDDIAALATDRDEWKDSCKAGNKRFLKAEHQLAALKATAPVVTVKLPARYEHEHASDGHYYFADDVLAMLERAGIKAEP